MKANYIKDYSWAAQKSDEDSVGRKETQEEKY